MTTGESTAPHARARGAKNRSGLKFDFPRPPGLGSEGLEGIRSVVFNGKVISVDLPHTVTLRVVDTAPALKAATAQAQTKPATLETGLVIHVPSYLESDELIIVDTRDVRFVSRAKG
jgi:hypothetical protein